MTSAYERGQLTALASFGLRKVANEPVPTWGDIGRSFGRSAQSMMIGEPVEYARQLGNGDALRPEGMLRNTILGGGAGTKWYQRAIHYANLGLPLLMAAPSLIHAPKRDRNHAIGEMLGGTAGMLVGSPMGMLGGTASSIAGSEIGGKVVDSFSPSVKQIPTRESTISKRPTLTSVRDQLPRLSESMSIVTGRSSNL